MLRTAALLVLQTDLLAVSSYCLESPDITIILFGFEILETRQTQYIEPKKVDR